MLEGADFLRLSDLSHGTIISTGFRVEGDPHYVVFENYDKIPTGTYYWFLGKEFRGDMVSLNFAFDRPMNWGEELWDRNCKREKKKRKRKKPGICR